ncbi:MAG: dephospho-CoA kinase [Dongiaceae bacterium]
MIVMGLTGSIGMGKSTAAAALRRLGVPVHDADREVHRLLASDAGAIAAIGAAFPGVADAGGIDRADLGALVFGDPAALARLESILHPLVRDSERRFLRRARATGAVLAVLDIPLLFESGAERRCDLVAVVSAPEFIQAARVLRRPGMSRERLTAIRMRQTPEPQKYQRADYLVPTGLDRRTGLHALTRLIIQLRGRGALGRPRRNRRSRHA